MAPIQKKACLRKLTGAEVGTYRLAMKSALDDSPDPYMSVLYLLAMEGCREHVRAVSARTGRKITLTHLLNKLLALAVAENPVYNQIILGGSLYAIEGVHIANTFMLPGRDHALTFLMIENAHLKSLEDIQHEMNLQKERKTQSYAREQGGWLPLLGRLYFKTKLYRLISDRIAFTIGFQKGLTSNIMLSNHVYTRPGNFIVLKPVIAPQTIPVRVHACGPIDPRLAQEGHLNTRACMPLHVAIDHRILWGIHMQQFGESLKRIAAAPEKYL